MKEEVNDSENKKSSKLTNFLIIIIVVIISIFIYSKYVETNLIRVREYLIRDKDIPSNFTGVIVVYFSDILFGSVDIDYIEKLVTRINEMKPDIVIYGGSLISKENKINDKDKKDLIKQLNNINSNLGKYYVSSNIDNKISDEILTTSGYKLMNNLSELIYNENNTPICIYGVGSYNLSKSDLTKLNECNGYYTILFTHEPDVTDKILNLDFKPNIILAGNSLGGEINVPFYNNLIKYKGSNKYYLEKYSKNNIDIYISNGIGTDKLGLRLNNMPSFSVFRLKSTD